MAAAEKLPGIHALRVIAAIAVYLLHILKLTADFPLDLKSAAEILHFGVPLFFAASAFSLMYSTQPYAGTPGWVGRFYLKRYFRIAPLFYLMLVVDVVLVTTISFDYIQSFDVIFPQRPYPGWQDILLSLTFTFGLSPDHVHSLVFIGWSVGTEMLFYLVFPLVLLSVRGIRSALLLFLASIVWGEIARPMLDTLMEPYLFVYYSHFHIVTNFRYFAAGVLAFQIFRTLRSGGLGSAKSGTPEVILFHGVCATMTAVFVAVLAAFDRPLEQIYRLDMAVWSGLFIVLCVWFALRPLAVLRWAPIQFLGERSYSLYLVHMPVLLLLAPVIADGYDQLRPAIGVWAIPLVVVAAYLPVVALSTLTYALVERPGMDLGRLIIRNIGRRRAAIAVPISGDPSGAIPPPSTQAERPGG